MKDKLYVAEIFGPTIQGEGHMAGKKVMFIRFAGCDYKCSWCDSASTHTITEDTLRMSVHDIFERCSQPHTNDIVITGGNPAIQNLGFLIYMLKHRGFTIHLETQGSFKPPWLAEVDHLIVSPKPPSSGMDKAPVNIQDDVVRLYDLNKNMIVKIPIFNEKDYVWAEEVYDRVIDLQIPFYLSVGNSNIYPTDNIEMVRDKILERYVWLCGKVLNGAMKDVFVLPQLHVLLWGNKQGV